MRFFKLQNVVKRLQNRIHNTSWSLRGLGGGGGGLASGKLTRVILQRAHDQDRRKK